MGDQRVLVYQLGSIGDTVVSLPALRAVRRHFDPIVHIALLHETRANPETTPRDLLWTGSEVGSFIGYPSQVGLMRKVSGAISLWNCLRAQGFSAVIYLAPSQRSPAQVLRDREFFEVCGIRRRLAFYAFDDAALHPQEVDGHPARVRHEALWRLERLRQDGIDVSVESNLDRPFLVPPPHELDNALLWLGQCRHWPARSLVAICPGAKQPTNLWPLDRFEEIGRRLLRQEAVELIVVGGKAERAIGARMVEVWGTGLNAAGEFSVLGSAALLGQCAFVIGLDTGTTHLAAAQGIPCVALYGERENPGRWEPLGQKHIVVRHRVLCAGCRIENASCPVKDHPCMTGITVDVVWQAVQQMLSRL